MIYLALSLVMTQASLPPLPEPPREFRAAWVATVDNIDWPSKKGLSTQRQRDELEAIFQKASELNLNAIIFQIRPHADAMYASDIEPWSEYLTGRQGRGPQPHWDPLAYAVEAAHRRGIELHVWFNPYRSWHPAATGPKSDQYIGKTNPEVVKTYGRFEWMDPGEPLVQKRTLDVMLDVVDRYAVDGIHIDDYFYPYPIRENNQKVDFPDGPSWNRYRQSGGALTRDDWRRKKVDDFVEQMYKRVKAAKPWVKVGISPFGIYRPGIPEGIRAGVDQYAELYADAQKWLVEGWCDYYTPQLYWPIAQTAQSYPTLLKWWLTQNPKQRHLWPGQFTSRTNPQDGNWKPTEVTDQIKLTREMKAGGNVHFSFKAFQRNWNGISDALAEGPYLNPALIPASPWLDGEAPQSPTPKPVREETHHLVAAWEAVGEDVQFYAVYGLQNGRWVWWHTSDADSVRVSKTRIELEKVTHLAIRPVDRVNNLGDALIVALQPSP